MNDHVIETWPEIAKRFPFSEWTLRRKYGKAMIESGTIFKSRVRRRNPETGQMKRLNIVWTTENRLDDFLRALQKRNPGWKYI